MIYISYLELFKIRVGIIVALHIFALLFKISLNKYNMKNIYRSKFIACAFASLLVIGCDSEDDGTDIEVPETYAFSREGASSVSFSGQSTRIAMAEELVSALSDPTLNSDALNNMFNHVEGASDFSDSDLNDSDKSVRSKVAASTDYYSEAATDIANGTAIKELFDSYIESQVTEVFPNWEVLAVQGTAGQISDGSSTRYVSAKGVEYNQIFGKSLIGGLMLDQIVNNYLSTSRLDDGSNVENNDADVLVDGKSYTTIEHFWDEAYGYIYGASVDPTNPNATLGDDDSFLNKYISRVEDDDDFAGIADDVFEAFKTGRAAIVASDYDLRDDQIAILREKLSLIIGVRAVYYLQSGKVALESGDNQGGAFHDLSEGLGFVNSLQFTRVAGTDAPYFSKSEVESFLDTLLAGDGLYDVSSETLDSISEEIATEFGFTVAQAAP